MQAKYFTIPGINGSGHDHWQTKWERQYPNFKRVEQRDWTFPNKDAWASALERQLRQHSNESNEPIILVAHSMGVHTVAQLAKNFNIKIAGALLVAPPNVKKLEENGLVKGYLPQALDQLPFPSIVVASNNDPYATIEESKEYAEAWGSEFINIGNKGHINADAGLGLWRQGVLLLNQLLSDSAKKKYYSYEEIANNNVSVFY
jgi:uncharacterized protein